jgi:hypothetical protein
MHRSDPVISLSLKLIGDNNVIPQWYKDLLPKPLENRQIITRAQANVLNKLKQLAAASRENTAQWVQWAETLFYMNRPSGAFLRDIETLTTTSQWEPCFFGSMRKHEPQNLMRVITPMEFFVRLSHSRNAFTVCRVHPTWSGRLINRRFFSLRELGRHLKALTNEGMYPLTRDQSFVFE